VKAAFIENLATRILRPVQHERHTGHYVGAGIECGSCCKGNCTDNINRRSCPREDEAIHGPTAQRGMGKLAGFRRGQIVGHACGEGMPNVKVRIAAVYVGIGDRCRCVEVGSKCIR
jgi:hypothetical protein